VRLLKQSKAEELAAAKAAKGVNADEVCDEATAISTAIMQKMKE